ncbi:hypothetical protein ABJI51_42575 [Amycolatopsis sp. NEAU-NG30]|uniref:Uncharacterized protein n=1 Tax=Amycolatopsis melonis TaxID=3156488 RepID=A0ABV0LU51_9PSEU
MAVSVLGPVVTPSANLALAAGASTQSLAADKVWVQYLAKYDPRSTVRIAAWQALLSSAPDAAIAQFVTSGYDYAVKLAAERKARNMDFAKRVLATYTAEFSPEVHAAAQFAVNSRDDADRERFANGGFAAAKQRDTAVRDAKGEQAAALVEADRAFVRNLAANDPGAQVRVSASYAVRVGATDSDLVDFFASGWAFGARLDLETFRQRSADDDTRWRAALAQLMTDAAAAEQAAKDASADLAEQARAKAVQAWQAVGAQTTPARSYWSEARDMADTQAANWAAVYAAASAASGPNWTAIRQPAQAGQADWDAEREFAAQQAAYWNSLLQQALDGEQRVRAGA